MIPPNMNPRCRVGIELFNQGKFFEAHEAWEEVWKTVDGDERLFYQGIIQAAAALLHLQRGNYAGAISLYRKGHQKLCGLPPNFGSVELERFRVELASYFCAVQAAFGTHQQLSGTPQIAGTHRSPTIEWVRDS
jgi:uncharacterized protein